MKHIFLTGEKNCGKTTLLTQALAKFRVSGFSSKILPPNEIRLFRASLWFGLNSVFAKNGVNFSKDHASNATLIPACVEAFFEKSEENLAGVCGVRDSFTQAFERLGVEILRWWRWMRLGFWRLARPLFKRKFCGFWHKMRALSQFWAW